MCPSLFSYRSIDPFPYACEAQSRPFRNGFPTSARLQQRIDIRLRDRAARPVLHRSSRVPQWRIARAIGAPAPESQSKSKSKSKSLWRIPKRGSAAPAGDSERPLSASGLSGVCLLGQGGVAAEACESRGVPFWFE